MIEGVTEEMHGVELGFRPETITSPFGWYGRTFNESEMTFVL
jgi:hypothetical protein